VGTRLITSWGEPALGGVYKLVAVYDKDRWLPAIKISESPSKTPNPGEKRLWRVYDQRGKATADLISLESEDPRQMENIQLRHPTDHTKSRILHVGASLQIEPLLVEILRAGERVYPVQEIEAMRALRQADVERLDPGVRRIMNPHIYHVSLTQKLWDLKQALIQSSISGGSNEVA
jgi:nicotinate phosphoribosyltransferase